MGFVPGVTLRKWRTVWEERFPRVPLDVVEVTETDQRELNQRSAPRVEDGLYLVPKVVE